MAAIRQRPENIAYLSAHLFADTSVEGGGKCSAPNAFCQPMGKVPDVFRFDPRVRVRRGLLQNVSRQRKTCWRSEFKAESFSPDLQLNVKAPRIARSSVISIQGASKRRCRANLDAWLERPLMHNVAVMAGYDQATTFRNYEPGIAIASRLASTIGREAGRAARVGTEKLSAAQALASFEPPHPRHPLSHLARNREDGGHVRKALPVPA